MNERQSLGAIRAQIIWDRLLAVVEEQAQTLLRTAFSTTVREAGDLSAGVFDRKGRMLAQAITGTPGHVNAMAASVGFFLQRHPVDSLRPGDVLVTNDPWFGNGHLNDFTVVTPVFRNDRCVALFAATSHIADVGGLGFGPDGRQVFEEGLNVPIGYLFRAGEANTVLFDILRANVRDPRAAEGDLYSLAACNDAGAERLLATMVEFGLDDLDAVAEGIIGHSRDAMLAEIRQLPHGTWRNEMRIDGYDEPVDLVCTVSLGDDGIEVDFAGTSPVCAHGINVPLTYTQAYASFGVRCVIGNDVPNNAGSLGVVRVTAPEGCILNAPRPAAVSARHAVGQMLPDVVLGCLAGPLAGNVPAEGASCLFGPVFLGGCGMIPGFGDDEDEDRGPCRRTVRDQRLLCRWQRGATRQGRPRLHRIPIRSSQHAGRNQRERCTADHLAQGVPPRVGRHGRIPGRRRAGHGVRPPRRRGFCCLQDVRSSAAPAARSPGRRARRHGLGLPHG